MDSFYYLLLCYLLSCIGIWHYFYSLCSWWSILSHILLVRTFSPSPLVHEHMEMLFDSRKSGFLCAVCIHTLPPLSACGVLLRESVGGASNSLSSVESWFLPDPQDPYSDQQPGAKNQGLLSPPGGHGRYIRCESICVPLQMIMMTAILKSVKIQKNYKPALKLLWAGKTNFMKESNLNFGYFRDSLFLCHILCMPP